MEAPVTLAEYVKQHREFERRGNDKAFGSWGKTKAFGSWGKTDDRSDGPSRKPTRREREAAKAIADEQAEEDIFIDKIKVGIIAWLKWMFPSREETRLIARTEVPYPLRQLQPPNVGDSYPGGTAVLGWQFTEGADAADTTGVAVFGAVGSRDTDAAQQLGRAQWMPAPTPQLPFNFVPSSASTGSFLDSGSIYLHQLRTAPPAMDFDASDYTVGQVVQCYLEISLIGGGTSFAKAVQADPPSGTDIMERWPLAAITVSQVSDGGSPPTYTDSLSWVQFWSGDIHVTRAG